MYNVEKYPFKVSLDFIIRGGIDWSQSEFEDVNAHAFERWFNQLPDSERYSLLQQTPENMILIWLERDLLLFVEPDDIRQIGLRRYDELEVISEFETESSIYRLHWRSRWVLTLVNLPIDLLKILKWSFLTGFRLIRRCPKVLFERLLRLVSSLR